jgi:hypothetical protein
LQHLEEEAPARDAAHPRSAYALGAGLFGLFGRHAGEPSLAEDRKLALLELWGQKQERAAARRRPAASC